MAKLSFSAFPAGYLKRVVTFVPRLWRRVWGSRPLTLGGWVAVNLPKAVTALGAALLSGIAALHGYVRATRELPISFTAYADVLAAGCVAAALAMALGVNPVLARWGWYLGSVVCLSFLAGYLVTRAIRLPGWETVTARWDLAPGTLAMASAAGFLALHATVLSGVNVAYPKRQGWHD